MATRLHETPSAPGAALSQRSRNALLTLHLVTAVGLVGVDLVLLVLGISGVRGATPATVYPAMHSVAAAALAPLAVVALGTGVLQALLSRYGLVKHWWVSAKLVITSLLTGLVLLVVIPGLGRAAAAATGPAPEHYLTDAQRTVFVVTPSTALVLLLLMAGLGVFKPGRQRRAPVDRL